MSSRDALELAGVGHHITHAKHLPDPRQLALVGIELGAKELCRRANQGPVLSAIVGKAVSKLTEWMLQESGGGSSQSSSSCGEIQQGSPDTWLGKSQVQVALADKFDVSCHYPYHRNKPLRHGSEDVWVNGQPAARRTDETRCGAHIGEGEPTVLLGAQTQTCSSLDMAPVDAALHQALDAVLGGGAGSRGVDLGSALDIGVSMASGKLDALEDLVPENVQEAAGAALSSDIGKSLLKGDVQGALRSALKSFGF